ncbi:ABC transporter ATP-binding protein [Allorhodopirellula heiligendammensis]|uniref:ABC transporter ATP-binding protein YbhF n=1 Tax=Allorhodopirellula heiligendammensis TaxID=2714739 RepID=A0A5C6C5P9_9BACT|nr:ABC transporter ATP-binding protein [Allorhodopirellula heiligendammensis]TWU18674.1 putative ABC transporter ATP-binding protein YbhF [Allorhodopirellula heiligendammensis]
MLANIDSTIHSNDLDHIVQTTELTKRYGNFAALHRCSLEVLRGEIFGLLGPNGAGKTTLIRLLLGYLHRTSGEANVAGYDPACDSVEVRRRVAYLPGDARLPRHMRGRGVLEFFAQMHPCGDVQRTLDVANRLDLDLSRRVAFMSTGMRQKLALAVVFGPRTPLLILDEPTANLDPSVRGEVLSLVLSERDEGRTVMFSSHVLSEIEQTCDRVAFLRRGELVRKLVMEDLFQRHRVTATLNPDVFIPEHDPSAALGEVPSDLRGQIAACQISPLGTRGNRVQIDTAGDLSPTLGWLASLPLHHVRIEPLGLHSVYEAVHLGQPDMSSVPQVDSRVAASEVAR